MSADNSCPANGLSISAPPCELVGDEAKADMRLLPEILQNRNEMSVHPAKLESCLHFSSLDNRRLKVLLVSIVPPHNDCGVRIVMHRHLVERNPFELHVASNAEFADDLLVHTRLRLPHPLWRLRKTRFGPKLAPWLTDYENLVWPLTIPRALEKAILKFKPDVILTLAETSLCHLAAKAAKKHRLPLAGLFLDWFPIMKAHFGHAWTQKLLSRRYRALYRQCDLALCTSDGMQDVLGPHPNSHVIYPMPGRHRIPENHLSTKIRQVPPGVCRIGGKFLRTHALFVD